MNRHTHSRSRHNKNRTSSKLNLDANYCFLPSGRFVCLFDRVFRRFAITVLRLYGRLFLGIRFHGLQHAAVLHSGALTICNHVHYVDSCMISCACPKRTIYYPTLKSNFEIPVVRWLLRHLYALPIPESPKALARFSDVITSLIRDGNIVHFFPEGSLIPYHRQLRPFRRGAFRYAYDCQVPVVPFVVTFRKATGFLSKLRTKPLLDLTMLEPVYPTADAPRNVEVERLMNLCHERMRTTIESVHPQETPSEFPPVSPIPTAV